MSLLAGLRARRALGEVVIELDGARDRAAALEALATSMIGCVRALVLDIEELGAPRLQADLADTLAKLRAGVGADQLAEETAQREQAALDYAARERAYLDRRDRELRRIIGVLRDGLAAVSSGSAAYHQQLLDNGARLEAASRLSDLVRMRAAITSEVAGLRCAIALRQAEESTTTQALRREVEQLRERVETARSAARTDPLTGAANRGAFDEELARCAEVAGNGGGGFALLLADIDHFKQINDDHGHPVGDRVLTALVTFLRARVRQDDLIARWGGEEFAVILPGASLRVALRKARAMVTELAAARWSVDDANLLQFQMSMGATAWRRGDTTAVMLARVDGALYAAKRGGRNRACKG